MYVTHHRWRYKVKKSFWKLHYCELIIFYSSAKILIYFQTPLVQIANFCKKQDHRNYFALFFRSYHRAGRSTGSLCFLLRENTTIVSSVSRSLTRDCINARVCIWCLHHLHHSADFGLCRRVGVSADQQSGRKEEWMVKEENGGLPWKWRSLFSREGLHKCPSLWRFYSTNFCSILFHSVPHFPTVFHIVPSMAFWMSFTVFHLCSKYRVFKGVFIICFALVVEILCKNSSKNWYKQICNLKC